MKLEKNSSIFYNKNVNMNKIQKMLFEHRNEKYASFQSKLTPGVDRSLFIGVKVPEVRKIAKELMKENNYVSFLNELPHKYYDENMLHGAIIANIKDYDECINYLNSFLPYIDNWAVCDTISPACFKKNKDKLIKQIYKWLKSSETYTIRIAIEMLMSHYLDDDYSIDYLEIVSRIRSKEYYVNMMIAWYFATALAKQYDDAIKYIENNKLDTWTHNKTIQKAIESYRISDEQKQYLRTLKR